MASSPPPALPAELTRPDAQMVVDALNLRLWELEQAVLRGKGSPAGVVVAAIGTLFLREDGEASKTLYVKESGSGTSEGWVAK
jgi:hypothetical protein